MGETRDTTDESVQSTSTVTPSLFTGEQQYAENAIASANRLLPGLEGLQQSGIDLGTMLLKGLIGGATSGPLGTLFAGISPEITTSIVDQSLGDLNTQLQKSGAGTFMESGPSQAIGTRLAGDIRNQAAYFNLNNISNLLSQGLGGQAQIQQPINAQAAVLGSRLQGLRPVTTTGSGFGQTVFTQNPFLKSFYSSLGSGLGSGTAGGIGSAGAGFSSYMGGF